MGAACAATWGSWWWPSLGWHVASPPTCRPSWITCCDNLRTCQMRHCGRFLNQTGIKFDSPVNSSQRRESALVDDLESRILMGR